MRNFCVKRPDGVLARIVVHPTRSAFDYYVIVEEEGVTMFKLWIYTLETDPGDFDLFKAKWKNKNELVIRIPSYRTEISVYVKECKATTRLARPVISPFELTSRRRPLAGLTI